MNICRAFALSISRTIGGNKTITEISNNQNIHHPNQAAFLQVHFDSVNQMSQPGQRRQSESRKPEMEEMVIDYQKFNHERRISRPPGVPTIWNRPADVTRRGAPTSQSTLVGCGVGQSASPIKTEPCSPGRPSPMAENFNRLHLPNLTVGVKTPNISNSSEPINNRLKQALPIVDQKSLKTSRGQKKTLAAFAISEKVEIGTRAGRVKAKETFGLSPKDSVKVEGIRPDVQTMSIEELNLRHKTALKKLQNHSEETNQARGRFDKVRLREQYKKEVDELRARMVQEGVLGYPSSTACSKDSTIRRRILSETGSSCTEAGNSQEKDTVASGNNDDKIRSSKQTWLDY